MTRNEARMSLIEHLGELRSRIIKVAIAFVLVAIAAWFFREQIFDILLAPAGKSLDGKLYATSVAEPLLNDIKLTLYTAFLVTIPILLYQIWAFIAPAVGDMGRTFTYILIGMASALFLAGVAFGYFVVLPVSLNLLLNWGGGRYENITTSAYYLSFNSRFLLAFGIVFELPAATYVAAKLELVDAKLLRHYRRHAIVANTVLAAVLTPTPDVFTMLLMAAPMLLMYELSIIIARYVNPTPEVAVHERDPDSGDFEEADDEEPGRNGYEEDER
ncbi:twin-arginine translocase subunit TatC [soil metagenome]